MRTSGRVGCSQGGVRADGVGVPPPAFEDDLRLAQAAEDLSIEQFIPERAFERLHVPVLPRGSWLDVAGFEPTALIQSCTAWATNSAVVRADVTDAPQDEEVRKDIDHAVP
jgi:hypothetical protein